MTPSGIAIRLLSRARVWLLSAAVCLTGAVAVQAAPLVVVVDAGHGGRDYGAVCHGVSEKDVTLAVARRLESEFGTRCGGNVSVKLTRDGDIYLDLAERARLANESGADVLLSLHCNSLGEAAHNTPSARGIEGSVVFVAPPSVPVVKAGADEFESSRAANACRRNRLRAVSLARRICSRLTSGASRKSCEVRQERLQVLTDAAVPAVLVELDYLTNEAQARWLASDEGQQSLARAICLAVIDEAEANGRDIAVKK